MKLFQLLEAPIDHADELNDYSVHRGEFSFAGNKNKFTKYYQAIGKGSARVAFLAPMHISAFKAEDAEHLSVSDSGSADTVIKLAINAKGLLQNSHEMRVWNDAQSLNYERFLAPIIDWSGNPKYNNDTKYTIAYEMDYEAENGHTKAPFWIQFPKAEILKTKKQFNEAFKTTFGFELGRLEVDFFNTFAKDNYARRAARQALDDIWEKNDTPEEMRDEFSSFLDMCKSLNLKLGDVRPNNVGLINGKMVLIDYGYTEGVQKFYARRSKIKVIVDRATNEVTVEES